MLIETLLRQLLLERSLADITAQQYERAVRTYSEFLSRPATLDDLNHPSVNAWLKHLEAACAPGTVRTRWAGLSAVWNYAAEVAGAPPPHPRRVRRVKVPQPQPTIWTKREIVRLIKTAAKLRGQLRCGISSADFMLAFILVGYCTGLRRGDLLRLRFDQIYRRRVDLTQHKTKVYQTCWLDAPAMRALTAIREPERERLFPLQPSGMAKRWRKLLKNAGLPEGRREGPQKLRRTASTDIAIRHGLEAAGKFLGHLTPGLAGKYYVPRWALQQRLQPRSIKSA